MNLSSKPAKWNGLLDLMKNVPKYLQNVFLASSHLRY